MEGGNGGSGDASGRRTRRMARRSSWRCEKEAPQGEGEIPEVEIADEDAPTLDITVAAMAREEAMNKIWSIVEEGDLLVTNERDKWTEDDKKKISLNCKAKSILCCALSKKEFNRISACKSAMEMWEKLRITYEGTDKVKETGIDILVTQYERFQMQPGESITQMFSRFTDITNALASLGKTYEMGDMVDVAGEIASLRALLFSAVQNREFAQREAEQLRAELERVRRAQSSASSSRVAESSQSDLEDRLADAVRRAEEARAELAEQETELRTATDRVAQLQGQVDTVIGERDQLRIRVEAAESRVAEATRELVTLRVQRSSVDEEELARLRADLHAQQTLARGLQEVMTVISRSQSRSRSSASGASGATGASVRQYLAGSSSRRRNEEEERHLGGETSAKSGRGGGEMPPPPDRHEGFGESGGGQ
ncbi:hypothetical protein Taro_014550 [Colocasia esculenta]|uniref:Uncharacterized protein n=1 Tax=Colocasia esculenta TaxID=4460 RepID=A0A843UQH4_COLES|nr:hypothetical protein [Colocasia esculenta]